MQAHQRPTAPAAAAEFPGLDGLTDRVRALAPLIAEHAAQAEADRKPADAVIEALERTGVFKSFVPRRFGGYEIDNASFVDIGIAVGEACTSTGWVTTFYLFVPKARSESLLRMAMGRGSGTALNESPRYRHPMVPLLCLATASPAIGAARQALDLFRERLGGRM